MKCNDIGGSNTFTHNHNCLIGTITFEVHHITLPSPRNTLATILKAFWFFLLFMFFAYFFLLSISLMAYRREKKIPNYVSLKHPYFTVQVLHLTKHGFYELHTDVLWLMSFSGKMVIYVFFLVFSSPSRQKEWFKIWKIRDQPNHKNHIKEPQNTHCLVVHEKAHLSYKRNKVKKPCFNGHPRYTSTNKHKHTLLLYFSDFFFW